MYTNNNINLLVATSNPGKLDEIRRFLSDLHVNLIGLKDLNITPDAPENGNSFLENSLMKAHFYCQKSGLPALADDGGFEIDALNGEPGVRSHRWVSGVKDDEDETLIQYTLERLKNIPLEKRGAQLRLVLALVFPDGKEFTAEAKVRGVIPLKPTNKRTPGFPFRSLLYLPEINKYYNYDELTPEETARFNHRKRALEKLKPIIRKILTT